MSSFVAALVGFSVGPTLHHLAVRAGSYRPFEGLWPRCETCGEKSWRWQCRSCGAPVRRRQPVWWLVTAGVFAGATGVIGVRWVLPAYLVFGSVTVVLIIADIDHKLIPNRILYPGGGAATVLLVIGAMLDGTADSLPRGFAGAAGYYAVFFIVFLVARGGFGFGDVKLAALLGLFTAFQSVRIFLLSVFFTGAYGGLPAILLLVTRRARFRDELPYGPAMVLGAWTALAFGRAFLDWYQT